MKSLNETEKREFAMRILNVLTTNAQAVKAAGVDPSGKAAMLKVLTDEAFAAEDAQIRMEADCRDVTARSRATTQTAYAAASGVVELIIGTIGSDKQLSRELRSLRKAITRGTGTEKVPAAAKPEKKTA
ncbi:MAG: hypothetical protein HZC28_04430 [Spirochaetes bacterium]|nr:hypothetical protein [Spirochaetota bacterium]